MNGNRPKWVLSISSPDAATALYFKSIGALTVFLEQEMDSQDDIHMRLETQQKGDL